jgi:hypothetical protein
MIEIRVPVKEVNKDLIYKPDRVFKEFNSRACMIIVDTTKGESVVGGESGEQKSL